MNYPNQAVARLDHLGVLRARGADAAKFLHGQLTQDFALLGPQEARLAALCNAKGRMLASFIGIKPTPDEVLLIMPSELLPSTLKRLSMFVLRAQVRLDDASADWAVYGLIGQATSQADLSFADPSQPWHCASSESAHLISIYPAAGQARALWLQAPSAPAPAGNPAAPGLWAWSEVASGVATITSAISEAFVPQMLNYESVGGVSFKKGCYPGQEVVARSQFRGTLKRRTFWVQTAATVAVGDEVFHPSDAQQPVGLVAAASGALGSADTTSPGGQAPQTLAEPSFGAQALVSMQLSAADGQALSIGPQRTAAQLLPLPYPLLEDI